MLPLGRCQGPEGSLLSWILYAFFVLTDSSGWLHYVSFLTVTEKDEKTQRFCEKTLVLCSQQTSSAARAFDQSQSQLWQKSKLMDT